MNQDTTISKAGRTRQFIIERVAPVFNRKGYAGTALSDLTAATGLTKGAIYGNFKNKDAIAAAAFRYNLSKVSDVFRAGLAQAETPLDQLRVFPAAYRQLYQEIMLTGGCPLLNAGTDTDDTHPELKTLVQEAVSRLRGTMESLIAAGIAAGQIKAGTDGDAVAGLIVALVEGGFFVARLAGERKYFDAALAHVEALIDGLEA